MAIDKEKVGGGTAAEPMVSGEYGFCPECGSVREVMMPPGDRLQERLRKAADQIARVTGTDVEETAEGLISFAIDELKVFGILENLSPRHLRSILTRLMQGLMVMERYLERRLDEPVDLLKETTEQLEKQAGHD